MQDAERADELQMHAAPAALRGEARRAPTLSHLLRRDSLDVLVNAPARPMGDLVSAWRNGSQRPFLEAARALHHTGSHTVLQLGPLTLFSFPDVNIALPFFHSEICKYFKHYVCTIPPASWTSIILKPGLQ